MFYAMMSPPEENQCEQDNQPVKTDLWAQYAKMALAGDSINRQQAEQILHAPKSQLLPLLQAAFRVRREYYGYRVHIHVLKNAKMGACPEDCRFCSQSEKFASPSGKQSFVSVDELVAGAKQAVAAGAKRYCMVTATRGPSLRDLNVVCEAARRIQKRSID